MDISNPYAAKVPNLGKPSKRSSGRFGRICASILVLGLLALAIGACLSYKKSTPNEPAIVDSVVLQSANGTLVEVPRVSGGTPVIGDSTGFKETPPVVPTDMSKPCGVLSSWKSLYDCVEGNHWQWYIDGVNQYASETGFNWNDVRQWATLASDRDVRVIGIYNWADKTDQQARNDLRSLVGDAINTMPIVRHDCITNTRGLEKNTLSPFVDCKKQVRVFLAPLKFDGDKLVGWSGDSGVFIDCYNLWWLGKVVSTPPQVTAPPAVPPRVTPPPVGPPTSVSPPPVCNDCVPPPPVCDWCGCLGIPCPPPPPPPPPIDEPCPPGTTGPHKPLCKDLPSRDPAPRGNAPQGGGHNDTDGPGEFIPPSAMERPPTTSRVNPPPPPPTPPPTAPSTSVAPPPVDPGATIAPDAPGSTEGAAGSEVDDSDS